MRRIEKRSCVADGRLTDDGCVSLPERQWNMWIPGYGSEEIRPFKKACTTEAHKQVSVCVRMSLCVKPTITGEFCTKYVQVLSCAVPAAGQ